MPQSDQGKQDPARSTNGAANLASSISLPKGGGAIRGIGEKLAANPVTGTGFTSAPIATSPGRSGFGSQLSLIYDSGAGNGLFGFGWSLSLPSIARKTDKGLPQCLDAEESDVFILSGAEDLVPVYHQDTDGNWVRDTQGNLVVYEDERDVYCVRRYRPRIEGLFARIERWTNQHKPEDTFWRSIRKDNITPGMARRPLRLEAGTEFYFEEGELSAEAEFGQTPEEKGRLLIYLHLQGEKL